MTDPNAILNDLTAALRARDKAIATMQAMDEAPRGDADHPNQPGRPGITWALASARADVHAHAAADAADALTAHLAAGGAMPDAWTPFTPPGIIPRHLAIRLDSSPEAAYRWRINRLADRINISADARRSSSGPRSSSLSRIANDVRHLADSLPTPEADQQLIDRYRSEWQTAADTIRRLTNANETLADLNRRHVGQLAQASTNRATLQARCDDLALQLARALGYIGEGAQMAARTFAEGTEPTTNPAP